MFAATYSNGGGQYAILAIMGLGTVIMLVMGLRSRGGVTYPTLLTEEEQQEMYGDWADLLWDSRMDMQPFDWEQDAPSLFHNN